MPARPPKTPAPRDNPITLRSSSSPQLGDPIHFTQYNKKTGRPIRKSAGKPKKTLGYVDSSLLDEGDDDTTPTSDSEEEDDMPSRSRGRGNKSKRKRKRSPSPPSPHLEPIIYNQELDDLTDIDELDGELRGDAKPITMQFNVPLGFHGPLFVKLDSTMLQAGQNDNSHVMQPGVTKRRRLPTADPAPVVTSVERKGFCYLAPELRNKIYRLAFTNGDEMVRIPPSPEGPGIARSSQFLRTCKLVYSEGCSILYGENNFHFSRHYSNRGPFWEHVPKEIGYQDALHFLKMIGPENLQHLRDVSFVFDDACPRNTPYLDSHEQRRYLNDEFLMNCLRILRQAKLRTFAMRFYGRRVLVKGDVKFLGYLKHIKADEVKKAYHPVGFMHDGKIGYGVWEDLKQAMERKKKLYEKKDSKDPRPSHYLGILW